VAVVRYPMGPGAAGVGITIRGDHRMKRAVLLAAVLAAAGAADDAPRGVRTGWTFEVTRSAGTARVLGADGGEQVKEFEDTNITFTEKVVKTADGRATEVRRTLNAALVNELDPETQKTEQKRVGTKGAAYRVVLTPGASQVTHADTGALAAEEWEFLLKGSSALNLWPKGDLKTGRSWSYDGAALDQRLHFLPLRQGRMDLAVKGFVKDPKTGLRTAQIRGTIKCKIMYTPPLDFSGPVEIDLPVRLGVPSSIKIEGKISGVGVAVNQWGMAFQYPIKGSGSFEQKATPTKATLAALGAEPAGDDDDDDDDDDAPAPVKLSGEGVTATVIGRTSKGAYERGVLSPDGKHYAAEIGLARMRSAVSINGKVGPACSLILSLQLSPDGSRTAYYATGGKAPGWFAVVDGKQDPTYNSVSRLTFGPNNRPAYCAKKGKAWFVVLDGKKGPDYDHVSKVAFSKDGKHAVYGADSGGEGVLVTNGKAAPFGYTVVDGLVIGPDGKPRAFAGTREGKARAVIGGKEGPPFDEIFKLTVTPDLAHHVYCAKKGDKTVVVRDGKEGAPWDDVQAVTLSPDGACLIYSAKKEGKWHAVLNGTPGPAYHRIWFPRTSRDGTRTAYGAVKGGEEFFVVDGVEQQHFKGVSSPAAFSPDGTRFVYEANKSKAATGFHVLVADGRTIGNLNFADSLVFRDDGTIAFLAGQGGMLLRVTVAPPKAKAFKVEQKRLGPFHKDRKEDRRPDDEQHFGYIIEDGKQYRVVFDGVVGPAYERVSAPFLSRRGGRAAYFAVKDDKTLLMVDGKKQPVGDVDGFAEVVFSPDGSRWAAVAGEGKKRWVIVNGKADPKHDLAGQITFSPDGKRCAYLVKDGAQYRPVVDGTAGEPCDDIGVDPAFTFSPDGKHVAYAVKKGDTWRTVIDGKAEEAYDGLTDIVFSADSAHRAYGGLRDKRIAVVRDGAVGTFYDDMVEAPEFAPAGHSLAYVMKDGGEQFVVVDGKRGAGYDRAKGFVFSPDGGRLAHLARKKDDFKWCYVIDGKADPGHKDVQHLVFSPDGKHVAYVAEDDNQRVMLDGKPGKAYKDVDAPTFAPVGGRFVYVGEQEDKNERLIENEKVLLTCRFAWGVTFSPDGRHLACSFYRNGTYHAYIDGEEGPAFDDLWSGVFIPLPKDSGGGYAFTYLATRDGALYRVTHTPAKAAR